MSGKMTEKNVKNLCRLCLSNGFSFSDIFLDRSFSGRLIYEAINFVYNLKIDEHDSLPSNICHPCLWKLIEFEAYKRNVLAAETELLDLVGSFGSNSVKEESQPDEVLIMEEDPSSPLVEKFMEHQKEDLEICVLGRKEDIADVELRVIPSGTSTTGSNGCSEQNLAEESFPANLQIIDVHSVSTLTNNPDMQSVQYCTRSKNLKADEPSVGKLHSTDSKSSVLSAVNSNLRKYKHPRNGQKVFKLSCANKYKCDVCMRRFLHETSFRNHLKRHSEVRLFYCSICSKGFKSNSYRVTHQLSHLNENLDSEMIKKCVDKSLQCKICCSQFSKRSHYLRHLNTHENTFSCFVCKEQFKKKASFDAHNEGHIRKRQFNCRFCRVPLKNVKGFKRHLVRHASGRLYSCIVCSRSFKSRVAYSDHVKTHVCVKKAS